jgi:hypothetical protein
MKNGKTFGEKAKDYFLGLQKPTDLPDGVEVLNPYETSEVQEVVRLFYEKFFSDASPRIALLGINPGRFGGGSTGISFTDPQALRAYCGIVSTIPSSTELSSRFVYRFIEAYGGAVAFYSHFYLGALYPLALIKNGKNYNYYDENTLFTLLKPQMVAYIQAQIDFGLSIKSVICLGQKNAAYFKKLNQEFNFFQKIHILDHPRYILQYKTRQADTYVTIYLSTLQRCLDEQ